jgi:hypothetical protein
MRTLDSVCRCSEVGEAVIVIGHWALVTGHWALGDGAFDFNGVGLGFDVGMNASPS